MTSAPTGRYPHLFTRQHLEPIETLRATILLRDDATCLARDVAITGRYWAGVLPCSTDVGVVSALPADAETPPSPIFYRTLCSTHAAFGESATTAVALLYAWNGWHVPASVDEPLVYAAMLPVRARTAWWLLDDWGDRHPLTDDESAELRHEIHQRWPS